MTEEQIDNSKPWQFKPGQSGNPGGRPKGKSITAELRKLLDQGNTAEELAEVLLTMSKRDLAALREVLDRSDGKVPSEHKIEADMPINIMYIQMGPRDLKEPNRPSGGRDAVQEHRDEERLPEGLGSTEETENVEP